MTCTFDAWETTPYLAHYGVLGMKWGVRKDRKTAYQKASKKLSRLNDIASKRKEKSLKSSGKDIKVQQKLMKLERKHKKQEDDVNGWKHAIKGDEFWLNRLNQEGKAHGEAHQTWTKMHERDESHLAKAQKKLDATDKRLSKVKEKADKIMLNAKKDALKSDKAAYEAEKWTKQMLKTFGETSMEELRKKYA